MIFQVFVTYGAKSDVRLILQWISKRSRTGAQTWYRRWVQVLGELSETADHCAVAPESEDYHEVIRQVIFKTRRGRPYRALFVIRNRDVFVLHVRGPGQDLLSPDQIRNPD